MSNPESSSQTLRPRKSQRRTSRRLWIWIASGAALVVILGSAVWLGARGLQAKDELEAAQAQIGPLKAQALAFDVEGASKTLETVEGHTAAAVQLTGDPIWRVAELIPFAGRNLTAVRELAEVTDAVVTDVVAPLIAVAGPLNPETLLTGGSSIDPQPLIAAIPSVKSANTAAQAALKKVNGIDTDGTLSQLVDARTKISNLLSEIAPPLESAIQYLPAMQWVLGVDAPRTFVVMFQNNAELRSLGGTALAFAEMSVTNGQLELVQTLPAGFNTFPGFGGSPIPIPDGASELYPGNSYGTFIANATLRPDFPTAGALVNENWKTFRGYPIDGVISIDPVALSYFLRGAPPTSIPSGDVVTSENLVALVLNELYLRFNSGDARNDNIQQDLVYGEIVDAAFTTLTSGTVSFASLLDATAQAVKEHRLMFWSSDAAVQARLSDADIDGALPQSDDEVIRAGVYVEDAVGSKLNYYLTQEITVASRQCSPELGSDRRVALRLASTVPEYVIDENVTTILGAWRYVHLDPGQQRLNIMLYAPPGSTITRLSVNGVEQEITPFHDDVYRVAKLQTLLDPGSSADIVFDFTTPPSAAKRFELRHTPLSSQSLLSSAEYPCQ